VGIEGGHGQVTPGAVYTGLEAGRR
jgi:hypothetical protein